jgi:hypothetical protein
LLKRDINIKLQELSILRETSINDQFGGCGGDGGNKEGGTPRSKVESAAVKIVMFENEISGKLAELEVIKNEISATIDKLPDPVERIILMWRYVLFKTWDEIINVTGYSRTQVFRFYRNALRHTQI